LARHWYDVDCLIQQNIADPVAAAQARSDVVEMKKLRWPEKGVDYEAVLSGGIQLIPAAERLALIAQDHQAALQGGMFYSDTAGFSDIVNHLRLLESQINDSLAR
jgi:hypothetical protein